MTCCFHCSNAFPFGAAANRLLLAREALVEQRLREHQVDLVDVVRAVQRRDQLLEYLVVDLRVANVSAKTQS